MYPSISKLAWVLLPLLLALALALVVMAPVTLIQRFGSAANINIHLHCLVLDCVYRRVPAWRRRHAGVRRGPRADDEALQAVLQKRSLRGRRKLLTRQKVSVEEEGSIYMVDNRPTTTVIQTRLTRSGRCRPPRLSTASPSDCALARRC